jgi:spheroidene monooxygenase
MPPTVLLQASATESSQLQAAGTVAVFLLADIAPKHRLWGYARFVIGRFAMRHVPGLVMSKVMGSGDGGGFGLKPSSSRQALFCLFTDEDSADTFLKSPIAQAYAQRAQEFCSAKLRAYSCRGAWSGQSIAVTASPPDSGSGPIATLTRASIRPMSARRFWRMQPASEVSLNEACGCLLATGVGEAPFFRQATFSLWANTAAMDAYARTGAHLAAIRASHEGAFFSESMFARFVPLQLAGRWRGQSYG